MQRKKKCFSLEPKPDDVSAKEELKVSTAEQDKQNLQINTAMAATQTSALTLLAIFASLAVLYVAKWLLIPITLAIFLNLLLSPLVASLRRAHIPEYLSAGVIVVVILAVIIAAMNLFAAPAETWLKEVPEGLRSAQAKIVPFTEPLERIKDLTDEVDALTKSADEKATPQVSVQGPGLITSIAEALPGYAAALLIVLFLTYFFLATGDTFLRKLAALGSGFGQRRRLVIIVKTIQRDLSRYLSTVTTINTLLGIAVAGTMYLLDAPNPILWGALATLLNFAPYLGAITMAGILAVVGFMSFDSLTHAVSLPLAYACMSTVEGNMITPAAVGRRLSFNPAVVFFSLIFWGWMWGIIGALLAVPLMVSIKVVLENIPAIAATARLMER